MNLRSSFIRNIYNYLIISVALVFTISGYYAGKMATDIAKSYSILPRPISLMVFAMTLIPIITIAFLSKLSRWLRVALLIYFLWVILYTVTSMGSWINQAVAFKQNGGPAVVNHLYSKRYTYQANPIRIGRPNTVSMSLKRADLDWGHFIYFSYFWGPNSHTSANTEARSNTESSYHVFRKFGRNWAIKAIAERSNDFDAKSFAEFVKGFKVHLDTPAWHPMAEIQFFNYLFPRNTPWLDPSGPLLVLLLPLGIIMVFFIASAREAYILTAALSPPQFVRFSIYLPLFVAILLVALIARSLAKRGQENKLIPT